MIIPAVRLIPLVCFVNQLITLFPDAAENTANKSNGTAIPTPNKMKLNKLLMKLTVDVLTANNTASEPGLHGNTTAPKNNPNTNALQYGFCNTGAFAFGINFEKSTLKMRSMLINASSPNAIGETIDMAFVNDACKNCVNMRPNTNIERMTPIVTITPNMMIRLLEFSSSGEILCERYARKPGYNGRTQTAPNGANNPAKNEIHKLAIIPTIQHPFTSSSFNSATDLTPLSNILLD